MQRLRMTISAAAALLLPLVAAAQTGSTVEEGKRAYMAHGCYLCHGTVGHGGVGPRLAPRPMPLEAMTVLVRHSPRSMPAYDANILPDADMRRIHAYLSSIAPSPAVEQIPQLR